MIIVVTAAALAVILYMYAAAPSPGRKRAGAWAKTLFAHRGLHGAGIAENTLEAFEAACANGYGIELDVQLSKDGEVVVFHDDDLLRMTGDARRVDGVDHAEMKTLSVGGVSGIPTFRQALETVDGRAPLLVEIKNGKRNELLCRKTMELMKDYRGEYVVESFNPLILLWLRKNAPHVIRGQLVGPMSGYRDTTSLPVAFLLANLMLNFLSRPDFVAYDAEAKCLAAPRIQRVLFRTPMAAWTVRDAKVCADILDRGEMPIFEGFMPEDKREV